MIEKLVKPELRGFIPYNANQIAYRVKLDANESPFDLSEAVRRKLAEFLLLGPDLNLYPDTDSIDLRKTLAQYWDVDMARIVVGTGSDQLIQVLANIFVGKGDKVICPIPSFSMYQLSTTIASGIPINFQLNQNDNYSYDIDKLIKLANEENAKMIYICTPNNPTGNTVDAEGIIKVLENCKDSIIIVDEAYAEFSGESVISLTKEYENLIVLRTFSKAYGLAGIRCGYSISSLEIADEINKVRPPYNISSLSQFVAKLVFEDRGTIDKQIQNIIEQREYLVSELSKIETIKVFPSKANYLLVKIPNSDYVNKELTKRGVLVRSFGNASLLEDCFRISVGNKEQNDVLLEELKSIL